MIIVNKMLLTINKLKAIINYFRKVYLKWLGLQFGKNAIIGKITCEWPSSVVLGDSCTIQDYVDFRISNPFNTNNRIIIGNGVFIGRCTEINIGSNIIIGNNCLIASNTTIVDLAHQTKKGVSLKDQLITSSPIFIENDVWIGTRAIILGGVKIGAGSVIGAGTLVNKSIPSNQIWGGVPARFIKNKGDK